MPSIVSVSVVLPNDSSRSVMTLAGLLGLENITSPPCDGSSAASAGVMRSVILSLI